MDPTRQLRSMVNGYQVSQALHAAAELGISDALASDPRDLADLARVTNTHEQTLGRLMRALETVDVYTHDADGRWVNTELGEQLRTDVEGSLGGWAAFVGRAHHWQAWSGLTESVRNGENAFTTMFGVPIWEYRRKHPEEQAIFDRGMTAMSASVARGVVASYDFGRFGTVADIGGGAGRLLAAILQRYPAVHGILFDQPDVVAGAPAVLDEAGVSRRCEISPGSFFESVPSGADAYLLKAVVHDWPDEESLKILRTCRAAMGEHGTLLLVEQLIGQGPDPVRTAFSDLNMLVNPGGQERTLDEYAALFEASGFTFTGVTATGTPVFVIEAAAVGETVVE